MHNLTVSVETSYADSRPSTMYTWTDNTDKNLKPNRANMTAFINLTLWFQEFNGKKNAIFKSNSLGIHNKTDTTTRW